MLTLLMNPFIAFLSLIWIGLIAIGFAKRKSGNLIEKKGFKPHVLVIVPCKGADLMFRKGLESIKKQTYPSYDIVAVPDSLMDPSVAEIKKAHVKYITKKDTGVGSNKVMAITTALKAFQYYGVYVIADSDIICNRDWLSELVRPLGDGSIGVSTAYPYFAPVKGSGFWARVKMVWGFVGNGLMESENTRFSWGGSMAFRKDLLDAKSMRFFSRSISDDIAITKIAKRKKLRVHYVNKSLVEVPSDDSFAKFSEWANRQTALSIRGYSSNFKYGLIYYAANALLLYSAIVLSIFYSYLCLVFLVPFGIRLWKTYRRARRKSPDIAFICLFIDLVYAINLVSARMKNEIVWRGVSYRIDTI